MKARHLLVWGAIAYVPPAGAGLPANAHAPPALLAQTAPQPPASPMVKPPAAAPGAASASNPDNMPMKKPTGPATNDKMMRSDPASGAQAK
ncbi:hypothetical protein [Paraburkholderia acidiphila]|uniref:Uncharacterized protein n=1 Tax=Paraburkholderia acidiphila TaxID=2571747 RepID=A0A7Z2GCP3_9BURK|nr:hypothetical protein [Paraburkholderia acidiphila]QGZ59080.1 hypothetical protein FAZ97_29535 [Paraburkholderia acidiphila]